MGAVASRRLWVPDPHGLWGPERDAPLTGPSVLALCGDASACNVWRCWQPFAMLQVHGYRGPAEWGWKDDPGTADYWQGFEAIILNRLSWFLEDRRGAEQWFALLRRASKRVFYECDDDLFSPFVVAQQQRGIARDKTKEELEAERQSCIWAMQRCDGVTVSTQRLATVVRQYTDRPVEVVPNAIDAGWFQAVQRRGRRTVGPGLTIGWAGGNRPDADLALMAEAWGRLARRYPDVTFVVMGHQPTVLTHHVPESRVKRLPWMSPYEYPIGLLNIDIGCCPLEDRPFNRAKSGIKSWEYALSGAAVVASPTVYRQCLSHGETGVLATTGDEWESGLAWLIEQADDRRAMAAALKRDVLAKWSLKQHYWRWPAGWRRLMEGS